MFELTASVLGGEPPVYAGGGLVALAFERRDLPSQQRFIADPAVQALYVAARVAIKYGPELPKIWRETKH